MSHTPSIVDHARVTVMTFTSPPSLPLQSGRLAAAHRNSRRCKPEKPVRTPGGSGRLGCSRFSRRPPIAPGSPRPTSPFPTIVLPMFGARHRTLAPIRGLRPADAGVCASRSGGGTSDNRTLPEYSPRPACDGGGHCATAGTPHSILRTRVLFDCAAAWTRLGVRVTRGRRPRRRRRGWLACAAGGGGNFD